MTSRAFPVARPLWAIAVAALAGAIALAPSSAAADPLLAAAGDIACRPGLASRSHECKQSATARLIERVRPSAVAALGDDQYDKGTMAEFMGPGAFNDTWGWFKPQIRPVPGNEEYGSSASAAGYFEYFGAAAGEPGAGYYSYQLGSWHVIALNSSCSDLGCADARLGGATSAEVAWLRADLAQTHTPCILAYWHHPLFSSNSLLDHDLGVAPLWRLLYAAKADVVLNGHAHNYERFARQDPKGRPTGAGIRQFVVGTGGRSLFGYAKTPLPTSQVRDDHDFGVLFLGLHHTSYDWAFRTVQGVVVDRSHAPCHSRST